MDRSDASTRRLGVLGTLVWDTLYPYGGKAPLEGWGGLTFALRALEGALPQGWEVVPVLRIGQDMEKDARALLRSLSVQVDLTRLRMDPEPNNRVELRYVSPHERIERLSGGVSGWNASELSPLLQGMDALYVNFISGYEMELSVTREVLGAFQGPVYGDLHSLFLSRDLDGVRKAQGLADWEHWFGCFDVVQMNEAEFSQLGLGPDLASDSRPWAALTDRVGRAGAPIPEAVVVTLGAEGAVAACTDLGSSPCWAWPERRLSRSMEEPALVRVDPVKADGDPTGCGDVWGATAFARILDGATYEAAFRDATRAAAATVEWPGTEGLGTRLRDVINKQGA